MLRSLLNIRNQWLGYHIYLNTTVSLFVGRTLWGVKTHSLYSLE